MKKIFSLIAVAFAAMSVNAQVYVGGSVGISSVKNGNADAETVYKFVPEVGYNLNDEWAIGVSLGYQKGSADLLGNAFDNGTAEVFQINPYARYTFLKSNLINVFVDGGVDFASYKDNGTGFGVGLKPGVAVNLSDKLSFVTHFGFVGYKTRDYDISGVDASNKVGVDLNGNNVTFGLYYNF